MSLTDANRPLRVFEKALQGGLGKGNLGVLTSRHGTGKQAVLMSVQVDQAMDGRNVLLISTNRSVDDVRVFRDEVLTEIEKSLDITDRASVLTKVERHSQINSFRSGDFSVDRLKSTLDFCKNHAEFVPELIEISGWPEVSGLDHNELKALKQIAVDYNCEIWFSHQQEENESKDERHMPASLAKFEDLLSVVIALEPSERHVPLRFVKIHDTDASPGLSLDFDPNTMLLRWR